MPKDEWGAKRICPTCSTRFYDLRTDPMHCPNCGATFTLESLTAVKAKALRPEKAKPEPVDIEDLPEIDADDDGIETDDDADDGHPRGRGGQRRSRGDRRRRSG